MVEPVAGPEVPEQVQRYLKRAARRNPRLHAELHANLYQRMLDHHVGGKSVDAAWDAALRDFGPARAGRVPLPRSPRARLLLALGGLGVLATAAAAHLGMR